MTDKELCMIAKEAMKKSYSPYSKFRVGAALLTASGKVYTGCNIENAAYSPTVCAERTAFFKAISEGETEFKAIAIVGGKDGETNNECNPCGVCRQVMQEFCNNDFTIITATDSGYNKYTLAELLPNSFSLK